MSNTSVTSVLFVCLGNICRSPLAKGIFQHQIRARRVEHLFRVDSCGTGGWHAGSGADPRTVQVAAAHGIEFPHIARQLDVASDLAFDYLLAMDEDNLASLLHAGLPPDRVFLMRSFDPSLHGQPPHRMNVPDPYYGGPDGFERVYQMLWSASEGLIEHILAGSARSRS